MPLPCPWRGPAPPAGCCHTSAVLVPLLGLLGGREGRAGHRLPAPTALLGPELARGPRRRHEYFGRLSGASAGVTRSGRVWQIPGDKLVVLKMGHYGEKPGACSAYPVSVHLGVAKGTVRGSLSYGSVQAKRRRRTELVLQPQ